METASLRHGNASAPKFSSHVGGCCRWLASACGARSSLFDIIISAFNTSAEQPSQTQSRTQLGFFAQPIIRRARSCSPGGHASETPPRQRIKNFIHTVIPHTDLVTRSAAGLGSHLRAKSDPAVLHKGSARALNTVGASRIHSETTGRSLRMQRITTVDEGNLASERSVASVATIPGLIRVLASTVAPASVLPRSEPLSFSRLQHRDLSQPCRASLWWQIAGQRG